MAIIKKGTYRFNDTVSILYDYYEEIPFNFSVDKTRVIDDETASVYLIDETYECSLFVFGETLFDTLGIAYGTAQNVNEVVYSQNIDELTLGWNWSARLGEQSGFTISEGVSGYGQIITVTEDQDVSDEFSTWFSANTSPVSTEVTEASIKAKIQSLITKANTTTGKSDTDLTGAVLSLAEGYGVGGEDSPLPIEVATESEMNTVLGTAEVGSVYKYTGTTGTYESGALYVVEAVSE